MKIAFLPIDNRPVCYSLPKLIGQIDEGIEFLIPPREYLGGINESSNIKGLFDWLEGLYDVDAIILSLDTLAYGGLVMSRKSSDGFDVVKNRVLLLKDILSKKSTKVLAFSSIMRISDNNSNEEEKDYWAQFGKDIYKYSYELDKNGHSNINIPDDILNDYLNTRKRNFEINRLYLELQKSGLFDTLVFSKDDCGEYGFNIKEAKELEAEGAIIKTGADEVPMSLFARAIERVVKIYPIYLEPECKNLISNYEDISVEDCVKAQIELAGCKLVSSESEADIIMYVNNFKERQGEYIMEVVTQQFRGDFSVASRPYMVADIRNTNGADNAFVPALLKNDLLSDNFYGYSGWNTTSNTLGSLICAAKVRFCAQKYNKDNFINLQIIRFLDDWAYQANVRHALEQPGIKFFNDMIAPFEQKIKSVFHKDFGEVKYSFPWARLFEVEIELS